KCHINYGKNIAFGLFFIYYSGRCKFLPDGPAIELWEHFIENNTQSGRFHPKTDTLILDGIPRNVQQAKILNSTLNVVAVFYMQSSDEERLVSRIQRRAIKENRLDDANLEVIRDRLHVYENETKPVLKFYGRHLVHRINADQPPAKVLADILRFVVKK